MLARQKSKPHFLWGWWLRIYVLGYVWELLVSLEEEMVHVEIYTNAGVRDLLNPVMGYLPGRGTQRLLGMVKQKFSTKFLKPELIFSGCSSHCPVLTLESQLLRQRMTWDSQLPLILGLLCLNIWGFLIFNFMSLSVFCLWWALHLGLLIIFSFSCTYSLAFLFLLEQYYGCTNVQLWSISENTLMGITSIGRSGSPLLFVLRVGLW